ncbi:hypothetical protein [Flavobacterium sp.]|uniref:hypothetical protein n=1 Tax=Flavobacterium sp. TaxID=239 RepID=UPI00374FE295
MATKSQSEFNKVTTLDDFIKQMQPPQNATMSQHLKVIVDSQNYLQKIYDDAFALGFEKGCEAAKVVDKL